MPKKYTILVKEGLDKKGYYISHFGGQKLMATKVVQDQALKKLFNMTLKIKSLKAMWPEYKRLLVKNYQWQISFADNPQVLKKLANKKGFEKKWGFIKAPLNTATEIK